MIIAVVTFVTLVLELATTRLLAYVGSSHATATALSIAMLGLGCGAAVHVRWSWWTVERAAVALPGALLLVAATAIAGGSVAMLAAAALAAFACAGMLVSGAYAARGADHVRVTYAVDLGAAALGCLVTPRLIGPLSPSQIVLLLALVACVLVRWRGMVIVAALLGALLVVPLPDGPLLSLLVGGNDKAITELPTMPADILDSAWSPLGRLDVRQPPTLDEPRRGVFTDGMSPTYMLEAERAQDGTLETSWGLLLALPYRALAPQRVLILGAGAGASVWLANKYGATHVDAVEVSPALPAVLARARDYAGDVYALPGVHLHIADARRFLVDAEQRYDMIELALALTGNAHAQAAAMEAHLYTVEAVELYLQRLTPTGSLVLVHSDPGNAYRQLMTVVAALERRGVQRPLDGIAVLRDPRPGTAYRYLLIARTQPMPLAIADALDADGAELLWGPGDPPERGAQLLDPAQLGATGRDDLRPVTDDRPYFFQNTRGLVATALAEPARLGVLIVALLLIVVLRGRPRSTLAACGLGAAYLGVELALIQRFTLAAGGTLYAVSFVLFCVLAWSGIGALVLGGVWQRRGVRWASIAASVAVAATALLVRDLSWLDAISSDAARLSLIAALLAPAGLALGGPFPTLLAREQRIASVWAVNGIAAVAGGIAAVLALRVGGATITLLSAALVYALVAAIAPQR